MKTTMHTQTQHWRLQGWSVAPRLPASLSRIRADAWDLLLEALATIAGVFEMPLRHAHRGRDFDRLDEGALRDIGYERASEPPSVP